jgi:hypothetical protein
MPALSKTLEFTTDLYTTGTTTVMTTTSVLSMPAFYKTHSTATPPYDVITVPSNPEKGTGYYGISTGLHTVTYATGNTFIGTVTMQATLVSTPVEGDWFDVDNTTTEYVYNPTGNTSTVATTFIGNFTWVRANVSINHGSLLSINYNF